MFIRSLDISIPTLKISRHMPLVELFIVRFAWTCPLPLSVVVTVLLATCDLYTPNNPTQSFCLYYVHCISDKYIITSVIIGKYHWSISSSNLCYQNCIGQIYTIVKIIQNVSIFIIYNILYFQSRSWQGVLDTTLCDKVCQWLAAVRWFSPISFINITDRHDITEILLKVSLNTIAITLLLI